jgi:hypothetical protein
MKYIIDEDNLRMYVGDYTYRLFKVHLNIFSVRDPNPLFQSIYLKDDLYNYYTILLDGNMWGFELLKENKQSKTSDMKKYTQEDLKNIPLGLVIDLNDIELKFIDGKIQLLPPAGEGLCWYVLEPNKFVKLQWPGKPFEFSIKYTDITEKPPTTPTYEDVVKELKPAYNFHEETGKGKFFAVYGKYYSYCCYSKEQAERIALRIKWLNIQNYVNKDWEFSRGNMTNTYCWLNMFEYSENKWVLKVVQYTGYVYDGQIFFKSKEAAELAMQIMGIDDFKKMNEQV